MRKFSRILNLRYLGLLGALLSLSACSSMDVMDRLLASSSNHQTSAEQPVANSDNSDNSASSSSTTSGRDELAQVQNLAPSSKTYPSSGAISGPQDFQSVKVGDWAVYKILKDGQLSQVVKLAVVAKTDEAWVYEFDNYTNDQSSALQMAVKNLNQALSTSSEPEKILWMKVKDKNGKITKIKGAYLGMMGGMSKAALTGGAPDVSSTVEKGGSVTVPAGTFQGTWKVTSQVTSGKASHSGTAWVSTLVPLWHVVKSVSDDGSTRMELVDFGTKGFVSAFE